jgi:putative aldouronate transport system permease protein
MRRKFKTLSSVIFDIVNHIFLIMLLLACLLPMLHIIAISFSDSASAGANLVTFWPMGFNTEAYKLVFKSNAFLNSFVISILRTVSGTVLNMILVIMAAYPLSKNKDEFPGRNIFMWFYIIPMLFGGGLIPFFMLVKNLGLMNNFLVLILPSAVPIFNVIILMNFFRGINKSILESATIDGAGSVTMLVRIMLPLSVASIATLTLFSLVDYWNEWFTPLIFMNGAEKWPLQTLLQQLISATAIDFKNFKVEDVIRLKKLSDRSFKAAQIVFSTIPILCVYPFLQKYFIKGLTLGSVKE